MKIKKKLSMYRILGVLIGLLIGGVLPGVSQSKNNLPRVLFATQNYYHPTEGSYVEFYLSFDASSLVQTKVENYYQSKLEVLYLIKKSEKVVKYDKFEVLGPKMEKEGLYQDFADVQTFTLKPGEYVVEVSIKDVNSEMDAVKASQPLVVGFSDRKMDISTIMFQKSIEPASQEGPFVKNGYFMVPWLVNSIPEYLDEIYVYAEVYNSDFELGTNGAYVEKHTLKNLDVDSVLSDYSFIKRTKTNKVNVILKHLNIQNLPQGSYVYSIELINRNNELVASTGKQFYKESSIPPLVKKVNIQALADFETLINSETNRDTLVDFFRCIRPLGDQVAQNFIDRNWKSSENEILQAFIINFWTKKYPNKPLEEWMKYRQLVSVVNKEFGDKVKKGYDTDMGMVYLQYGPPDQIVDRANEPSSYPYVIWQYYAHPKNSNAMYVFYDPTLVSRDYQLLHSNVRGEKNNPRWKLILQSRNNPNNNVDQQEGVDHWGGRVDEYYENPR